MAIMMKSMTDKPPPVRVAVRYHSRKGSTPAKRRRRRYISPLFDDEGIHSPATSRTPFSRA